MRRVRFPIPLSILLFIALTLAGTYLARKLVLERAMRFAMEIDDVATVRSLADAWPSPLNAALTFKNPRFRNGTRVGWTPLVWAIDRGHYDLADDLIDRGADVEARAREVWADGGKTVVSPLEMAADDNRIELVRHLLARGAAVEGTGGDRDFPLSLAVWHSNTEIMKVLIDHGADLERRTADGCTSLHCAASWRRTAEAKLLIERGANANALDRRGGTPLHSAASGGNAEVAAILLAAGADATIRDKEGRTPLSIAEESPGPDADYVVRAGRKQIAEILRKRGVTE